MSRIANNFDIKLEPAGTIQFYEAGTSTPKNTYPTKADAQAQTNANPNPITCDSDGRPYNSGVIDIWLLTDTAYKIVIRDSSGATKRTLDNYSGTFDPDLGDFTSKNIKFADNDGIQDSNGNEVIDVVKAASAVNFFQMKNSATGNDIEIAAAGSDSNVGIVLNPKGSGLVNINGAYGFPNADGTSSQYLTTNGSGVLSWTSLSISTPLPQGYLSGCNCELGSDTDHDIKFNIGVARDSSDTYNMDHDVAKIKQIDANWTEGNNAGGLASAVTLSANQTLHCFIITKAGGGDTDAGFDTSITAANLMTDAAGDSYVGYRRVFSIRTDASSNLIPFVMYNENGGYTCEFTTPTLNINTTITTSATSHTLASIPTGINLKVLANVLVYKSGATPSVYLRNPDVTDAATSTTAAPLASLRTVSGTTEQIAQLSTWTNTSAQIESRASTTGVTLRYAPIEFYDPRT